MEELKFEDLKISTGTYMAYTNIKLNIEQLFEKLPVWEIENPPLTKKTKLADVRKIKTPEGKIINLRYIGRTRGVKIKPEKTNHSKYLTSKFVCQLSLGDFSINIFCFNSGCFKLSGVKDAQIAQKCMKYLMNYISDIEDGWCFKENYNTFEVVFERVMTNTDFLLGFNIDRKNLNTLLNQHEFDCSKHKSSFETTKDSSVKFQLFSDRPEEAEYDRLRFIKNDWVLDVIPKNLWIDLKKKKTNKTTFMIFQSSKVVMSSRYFSLRKTHFEQFINLIKQNKEFIAEKRDDNVQDMVFEF